MYESYYRRGNQLLLEDLMLFLRALVWEYAIASVLSFSRVFDDLYQLRLAISFELSYDLVVFLRYKERKASANEELNAKEEELPKGNPLLDNTPTVFSVKRRLASFEVLWDDDVVSRIRHEVLEIKGKRGKSNQSDWTVRIFNHRRENNKRTIVHDLDRPRLSWRQKLEICLGAARGLHYIHTDSARSIIHRDMKSDNILFDENFMDKNLDCLRRPDLDQTRVSTT
ncbi:LOW QUALITY PROTEIN: hypothetical protein HID58_093056, partial [Brassica napus]